MQTIYCNLRVRVQNAEEESRKRCRNSIENAVKGQGVFECRIDFGPGYRIYFGKDGDALVILHGGGTKKRQQKNVVTSKILWKEYKRRKRQER
jgi:putative addiction module killer protein